LLDPVSGKGSKIVPGFWDDLKKAKKTAKGKEEGNLSPKNGNPTRLPIFKIYGPHRLRTDAIHHDSGAMASTFFVYLSSKISKTVLFAHYKQVINVRIINFLLRFRSGKSG